MGMVGQQSVKNEIEVISGDIRDFDSVFAAMQGCDTVFHLAAHGHTVLLCLTTSIY